MSFTTTGTTTLVPVGGGPLQVTANSTNPSNPITVIGVDANGNLNVPGSVTANASGTLGFNGGTQTVTLDAWRGGGGTPTLLTGSSATNTFYNVYTSGSVWGVQSAAPSTGLQTVQSMVKPVVLGSGYTAATPFTINIVAQNTGTGSATLSTTNVNAKCYQNNAFGVTLGALMSTAGAGQVGTAVAWPTTIGTISFVAVPGTAAPVVSSGTEVLIEVDAQCTNATGTTQLLISHIYLT